MAAILRCENLIKTYAGGEAKVQAVNGVTLEFEAKSSTAIIGPSGSGKSTLLHILGGLEQPTDGQVWYQGKTLSSFSDDQLSILRRRRFGFVFQAYNLVQELTAYENILLPVMLDGKKADTKHIDHLIERLDLGNRLDHLPSAMSGGQQQRVAIARALANKPDIIFADEPTGNLDGRAGREVLSLLKETSVEMGVTLILVTHDLHIAEQAQRLLRLEDGKIVADSTEYASRMPDAIAGEQGF